MRRDGVYRQVLRVFPSNSIVVTSPPRVDIRRKDNPFSIRRPTWREKSTRGVGITGYASLVCEIMSGAGFETGDPDVGCIDVSGRCIGGVFSVRRNRNGILDSRGRSNLSEVTTIDVDHVNIRITIAVAFACKGDGFPIWGESGVVLEDGFVSQ